jgi:hypothetical protein
MLHQDVELDLLMKIASLLDGSGGAFLPALQGQRFLRRFL